MGAMASQITCLTIVYSSVYSGSYQIKYQRSASLAFVRGIHQWPVKSPHKWPVTRKMFPFDDIIMQRLTLVHICRDISYSIFKLMQFSCINGHVRIIFQLAQNSIALACSFHWHFFIIIWKSIRRIYMLNNKSLHTCGQYFIQRELFTASCNLTWKKIPLWSWLAPCPYGICQHKVELGMHRSKFITEETYCLGWQMDLRQVPYFICTPAPRNLAANILWFLNN